MENFRITGGLKRRILVVDDEMINREILGNILADTYDVSFAENGKEAIKCIDENSTGFSLILLDLLMPEMDGFEFIEVVKSDEDKKNIPVIVMTSEKDAEVKSIKLGAADFITKPYDMPEVILARCERIIELSEGKSIIKSAERDSLTGLYSREFFLEYMRQIEMYDVDNEKDILNLNIDHFRLINEIYGRTEGNNVLLKLSEMIKKVLNSVCGIACRSEADNFYIYCNHQESYKDVMASIEKEAAEVSDRYHLKIRIGIYQNVDKSLGFEDWMDRAKTACDRIKGDYNQSVAYYNKELYDKAIYHEKLINDIPDAIKNKDIVVFYQPKYGIRKDGPVLRSAEALVRWKHPELGMISPGAFIPLFESNGLITKLDNYVWEEAASQIRKWKEKYGITVPVSVNVSRIDIFDEDLEKKLLNNLEINGLSPADYMLEITESAYSGNADRLIDVLNSLRSKGFKVEMDDFGTGYSSLNMITSIPIDVLKIDMKFIRDMLKDRKSLRLVELIVDIAKFINVSVVAEGVEEEEQANVLWQMGCNLIQGYYFSKPVPPEEFERFIQDEIDKNRND